MAEEAAEAAAVATDDERGGALSQHSLAAWPGGRTGLGVQGSSFTISMYPVLFWLMARGAAAGGPATPFGKGMSSSAAANRSKIGHVVSPAYK
jgi:hypothetical protein